MRLLALLAIAVVLADGNALAQATTSAPVSTATNTAPALTKAADQKAWSLYASAYTYIVPDSRNYVQPTFTADRDWMHLEARYSYEALDAGSVWVGYNFSGGDKLAWEFTPMLGGVFGNSTGIAPGLQQGIRFPSAARQRDGNGAFPSCNLKRRQPNASRRGRNEHRILRGQLRNVDQTRPSCRERHPARGRFFPRQDDVVAGIYGLSVCSALLKCSFLF
jgi:hypothetical protein